MAIRKCYVSDDCSFKEYCYNSIEKNHLKLRADFAFCYPVLFPEPEGGCIKNNSTCEVTVHEGM